ncbi:MAG: hypothetical protein R2828_04795 [Saprospiraceae bacterium]
MKRKFTNGLNWRTCMMMICTGCLLSSCFSPKAVIRIEPENEEVRWQYGQAFARQQTGDLEVQAAYNGMDKHYFFFDVEVTNQGEEEVLVDPILFSLDINGFQVKAIDPEAFLLGLDLDASRKEANAKNTALALGVVTVAAAVTAIATADRNVVSNNAGNDLTNDVATQLALEVVSIAPSLVINAASGPGVENLPPPNPKDRWFWTDFSLRKTTLRKGERVVGKVLFSKSELADRFQMVLPIGPETFRLQFKRMAYLPK